MSAYYLGILLVVVNIEIVIFENSALNRNRRLAPFHEVVCEIKYQFGNAKKRYTQKQC